jgi:hypothetical protein
MAETQHDLAREATGEVTARTAPARVSDVFAAHQFVDKLFFVNKTKVTAAQKSVKKKNGVGTVKIDGHNVVEWRYG